MPDTNPTPVDSLASVAGLVDAFRKQADRAQVEWDDAIKISPWEAEVAPEATWLRYAADFMERKLGWMDAELRSARAAIPGPDTITVNREALVLWMAHASCPVNKYPVWERRRLIAALDTLRAALSEPPAPKEQQP